MSPLIVILMAAGSAPSPQRPIPDLIFDDDYPLAALNNGEEGPVLTETLVSPTGKVDHCRVVVSSGSRLLDAATCKVIRNRAKFNPARGPDNRPIYGLYRQVITWSIGTPRTSQVGPDMELTVNKAPKDVPLPVTLTLAYVANANGAVTSCGAADERNSSLATLSRLTCQALSEQPAEIIRDHAGRPVDAMNSATVEFSVKR